MFSLEIDLIIYLLLGLGLVCALCGVLIGMRPLMVVARFAKTQNVTDADAEDYEPMEDVAEEAELAALTADSESIPEVSVIVHAPTSEEAVDECISSLLLQDHPSFEVIVVYEAGCESATILAEKYASKGNIRVTFVPPGSHNLSRRKLALTLGMKAARGKLAVTICANCRIPSRHWLSLLIRDFSNPSVGVVLGASAIDFSELTGPGRWYRQFDHLLSTATWLSRAIEGFPYRGDGMNMAFRRELFFSHKGYAKTINLHGGEDDLFVSELTETTNAGVMIDKRSILVTHWGHSANRIWTDMKERYDFTARWLPKFPFLRQGWLSTSQWVTLALLALAAILPLPNLLPIIVAAVIWMLFVLTEISIYRKMAAAFGAVRLWWAVPVFLLWHPIANFWFRLSHRADRFRNFTWQR